MRIIRDTYQKIIPENVRHSIHSRRRNIISNVKTSFIHLLDPTVRNMDSRLQYLKGAYEGERCFIMGNGPSLNKMDLNLFANDYVWAFNKVYLLFDRIQWRPKFFVSVDKRVTPDIADDITSLTEELPNSLFFFPFYFFESEVLESNRNVFWYREEPLDKTDLPYGMFSLNVDVWVSSVRTVTIAGLQLAVYLGFNPIYLIGCDTSYEVPSTVKVEDGRLISTEDDDANHFSPRYFGKGSKWHVPHPHEMIIHYQQVKKVCDDIGVDIYNATVGGKLEVFPRVDYVDLF